MKKIVLTLFLFTSISAFSQYNDFPMNSLDLSRINLDQLKFGIKVSPTISWVNIDHNDAIPGGAAMKFGVGITANYELNELLSVVSAIEYANIGGYMADSRTLNSTLTKDYYKSSYTCIDIPLGLKIKTHSIKKYNYYIQGGLLTGFTLNAYETQFDINSGKKLNKTDILKDLTYPSYVGYFAGVGARYNITEKLKFFTEVNYKNALTSIANGGNYTLDTNHSYTEAIQIKPAFMEFSLGLEF